MTAQIRHIRAGAPAPVDTRSVARHMSHPDTCAEYLTHTHRVIHTSTPQEREYARYDRDPMAKAWLWRIAGLSIAAFVAAYIINR